MTNMFYIAIGFVAGIWFTKVNPAMADSVLNYVSNLSFVREIIQ